MLSLRCTVCTTFIVIILSDRKRLVSHNEVHLYTSVSGLVQGATVEMLTISSNLAVAKVNVF